MLAGVHKPIRKDSFESIPENVSPTFIKDSSKEVSIKKGKTIMNSSDKKQDKTKNDDLKKLSGIE